MTRIALLLLAAAPLAAAQASPPRVAPPQDPYGSAAILDGNFLRAEARLEAAVRRGTDLPEVRLNLAQIYHATGREAAAAALYRAVLASPDVELLTPRGNVVRAHALADRGLARGLQTASR